MDHRERKKRNLWSSMRVAFLVGLVSFAGVGLISPPPAETVEGTEYKLRINPNPVSESDVPSNAVVVDYEELSQTQKEIVLDTMGDKEDGLMGSYVASYEYTEDESKPAKSIANADYVVRNDNQYYAVFSTTESFSREHVPSGHFLEDLLFYGGIGSFLLAFLTAGSLSIRKWVED